MVVRTFIDKIWRRDDSKKANSSNGAKDEKVKKYTKKAIKKYSKTLRRLAYE